MRLRAALLGGLLTVTGVPAAAAGFDARDAVGLFADQAVPFVVEAEEARDEGRLFRLRSAEPIERRASGALYLRATLSLADAADAAAAAAGVERRLAAADPDTGLSYAWDLVAAGDGFVAHLSAACTFPEEAFGRAARALARRLSGPAGAPSTSFWCRCGGGCRAGLPLLPGAGTIRRVPPVRRPADVEEGEYDNRLDPSGTWSSEIGELSLIHDANRLAFSYMAVFGATAHICEGAGIAGLVALDRYEYLDEQGTVVFTIRETEVRMELGAGIASFCGAGWAGDRFTTDFLEPPAACAVAAEHTHLHVVDTVDLGQTPFTLGRGSPVEAVPARHTGDEEWVLGRAAGPAATRLGLLRRAALSCPPPARLRPAPPPAGSSSSPG